MALDGTRPVVIKATKEYICPFPEIMRRLHKIIYILACCEQRHVGTIFFSTKLHPPSVSPHRRKHPSIQGREANDFTLKCGQSVGGEALLILMGATQWHIKPKWQNSPDLPHGCGRQCVHTTGFNRLSQLTSRSVLG